MRTPNQDPNTRGPQRVSNNNRQITHQIPTKGRWSELQDAYFTASKENIALSPDKLTFLNFLARSGTVVTLKKGNLGVGQTSNFSGDKLNLVS